MIQALRLAVLVSVSFGHTLATASDSIDCEALLRLGILSHKQTHSSLWSRRRYEGEKEQAYTEVVLNGASDQKIRGARFSQNGTWLGATLADGSLALWNLRTQETKRINIEGAPIDSFEFRANSKQVIVYSRDHLQAFDLKTATPASTRWYFHQSEGAYLSPNGRWLLANLSSEGLNILKAPKFLDTKRIVADDIDLKLDGDFALGVSQDFARITHLPTGKELAHLNFHTHEHYFGSLSAKREIVVLSPEEGKKAVPVLRDLKTLQPLKLKLEEHGFAKNARFGPGELSPDGEWVYATYTSGPTNHSEPSAEHIFPERHVGVFWNTRTGKQIAQVMNAALHPKYSPDGRFAAIEVGKSWDRDRGQPEVVIIDQSGTIKYSLGKANSVGFFGSVFVTREKSYDPAHLHDRYHFTDAVTGASASIESQQPLEIAPDAGHVFYLNRGAIHLFKARTF